MIGDEDLEIEEEIFEDEQPEDDDLPDLGEPADGEGDPELSDEDGGGDEPDWEALARADGWKPEGRKSARQYVEDGERMAATQKRKYEREAKEREAEFEARIARIENVSKMALSRQREQLEARYGSAQREAIELADLDRYDALEQEKQNKLKEFDKTVSNTNPAKPAPMAPEVIDFRERNTWFDTPDTVGETQFAVAELDKLQAKYPNATLEALLPHVESRVMKAFPELSGSKAPSQRRPARRTIDRGGVRRTSKPSRKLPAEAVRAGKEFVEQGVFETMAEYEAAYWAQEE